MDLNSGYLLRLTTAVHWIENHERLWFQKNLIFPNDLTTRINKKQTIEKLRHNTKSKQTQTKLETEKQAKQSSTHKNN